jgi:hypothetical protein
VLLWDELEEEFIWKIASEDLLGHREDLSKDRRGQGHDCKRKNQEDDEGRLRGYEVCQERCCKKISFLDYFFFEQEKLLLRFLRNDESNRKGKRPSLVQKPDFPRLMVP